jgi:hypothetical protein
MLCALSRRRARGCRLRFLARGRGERVCALPPRVRAFRVRCQSTPCYPFQPAAGWKDTWRLVRLTTNYAEEPFVLTCNQLFQKGLWNSCCPSGQTSCFDRDLKTWGLAVCRLDTAQPYPGRCTLGSRTVPDCVSLHPGYAGCPFVASHVVLFVLIDDQKTRIRQIQYQLQ